MSSCHIGVAFLAYGMHAEWRHAFRRFADSYQRHPAGIDHHLYIIFKGYEYAEHLHEAERFFSRLDYTPIHIGDRGFGILAYKLAARSMVEEMICFLNTKSEILSSDWLLKLALQLRRPEVGLAGNTGSFESLARFGLMDFPDFPNVHVRTNGFLVRAKLFNEVVRRLPLETRLDGWKFESGWNSLTREVLRRGLKIVVAGRDGKGYEPRQWPASGTFRSLPNANVLIADDANREFSHLDPDARTALGRATWGDYLDVPPKSDDELFVHSPLSQRRVHRVPAFDRVSLAPMRWLLAATRALCRRARSH
jgi:hypothetical protein